MRCVPRRWRRLCAANNLGWLFARVYCRAACGRRSISVRRNLFLEINGEALIVLSVLPLLFVKECRSLDLHCQIHLFSRKTRPSRTSYCLRVRILIILLSDLVSNMHSYSGQCRACRANSSVYPWQTTFYSLKDIATYFGGTLPRISG